MFTYASGGYAPPNDKLAVCKNAPTFNNPTRGVATCTGSAILTNENTTVPWDSAITDLSAPSGVYSYPTNELLWSNGLALSCSEHTLDTSPCGMTGHTGLDTSDAFQRARRYISYTSAGENIAYG
jgi:hypothetical protein